MICGEPRATYVVDVAHRALPLRINRGPMAGIAWSGGHTLALQPLGSCLSYSRSRGRSNRSLARRRRRHPCQRRRSSAPGSELRPPIRNPLRPSGRAGATRSAIGSPRDANASRRSRLRVSNPRTLPRLRPYRQRAIEHLPSLREPCPSTACCRPSSARLALGAREPGAVDLRAVLSHGTNTRPGHPRRADRSP